MQQSRTWKTNQTLRAVQMFFLHELFFSRRFSSYYFSDCLYKINVGCTRETIRVRYFQFCIIIYVSLQRQYVGVFAIVHSTVPKSSLIKFCSMSLDVSYHGTHTHTQIYSSSPFKYLISTFHLYNIVWITTWICPDNYSTLQFSQNVLYSTTYLLVFRYCFYVYL